MKLKLLTLLVISIPFISLAQTPTSVTTDSLQSQVNSVKKDLSILKRIKVSGYIQPQFQMADSAGQASFAGGNFAPGMDNRFMIRRGRFKVAYTSAPTDKGITMSQYVLQIDATERGFALKEAYAKITDPWIGWVSVNLGMFDNPFGFEISYSSGSMESPERGRMSQLHFPNEGEVGAMLTLQGPKNSKWNFIKWQAGFFNGNGSPSTGVDVSDWDSFKDFSTRLGIERSTKSGKVKYSGGVSYYDGGFRVDSVTVYNSGTDANGTSGFIVSSLASDNGIVPIADRDKTKRQYIGADAQVSFDWIPGNTMLRAEYITGDQPGVNNSAKSPNDKNPVIKDVYERKFDGAYFYFIQTILKSKFQTVIKYDWYDPNTDVKGDDLGKSMIGAGKATNETDVRYDTWGFGFIYNFDPNIKITAYYDYVKNETSSNLAGFTKDRPDNVFTLRMQVKF